MTCAAPAFCPALWFSGFFALGSVVHLFRFVTRLSLVVNGHEIPLAASVVLAVGCGVLSLMLGLAAIKRPCREKKEGESCCKH